MLAQHVRCVITIATNIGLPFAGYVATTAKRQYQADLLVFKELAAAVCMMLPLYGNIPTVMETQRLKLTPLPSVAPNYVEQRKSRLNHSSQLGLYHQLSELNNADVYLTRNHFRAAYLPLLYGGQPNGTHLELGAANWRYRI